ASILPAARLTFNGNAQRRRLSELDGLQRNSLDEAWRSRCVFIACRLEPELAKLRCDVLGRNSFKVGGAAAALPGVTGKKVHLCAEISFVDQIFSNAFLGQ